MGPQRFNISVVVRKCDLHHVVHRLGRTHDSALALWQTARQYDALMSHGARLSIFFGSRDGYFFSLSSSRTTSVVTLQSTISVGLIVPAFCLVLRSVVSMKSTTTSSVVRPVSRNDLTIWVTDSRASLSFRFKNGLTNASASPWLAAI